MTQYFPHFVFITSGITIGNDALLKLSASPKNMTSSGKWQTTKWQVYFMCFTDTLHDEKFKNRIFWKALRAHQFNGSVSKLE